MNRRIITICALLFSASGMVAQEIKPLNFEEVFSVVKTNLTDMPESELRRLAAIGFVKELGTKVQLVSSNEPAPEKGQQLISRKAIYNENYGYLRVSNFQPGLPEAFEKEFQELGLNKKLKGLVLDLRYAGGPEYEAAAQIADKFVKGGEPLIKLGDKEVRSTEKSQPIRVPVGVLVNGQTTGAAEAFAGMMRETGAALIIGQSTAGAARLFETFTLSTGQKLRIGTVAIEVGEGKSISSKGLTPDIQIPVPPELERAFYQDPYRSINLAFTETNEVTSATNRLSRRFNEAELVRRHREGVPLEADEESPAEPAAPVIMDPILARALDFLKGVSVLQEHRS